MLTNRKRIKLPRHPPTMSPVFTPNKYAPLYHALLANGNIHLFVSTNRSSPPISWPITARLRFKPRRLGCDPREPGSEPRDAPWNWIRDPGTWSSDHLSRAHTLFVIMKFWSINPSPRQQKRVWVTPSRVRIVKLTQLVRQLSPASTCALMTL